MYFITNDMIILSIRSLAAVILAEISQNNVDVQLEANNNNVIPELCKYCLQTNNNNFATKLLFAISSIVRNNPQGENSFRDNNMAEIFTKGIESGDIPFMRRTLFFINYFINNSKSMYNNDLDDCLIPNIFSLLYVEDVDTREETLKLLIIQANVNQIWKSKMISHKKEIDQAIDLRSNLIDISNEQIEYEKGQIDTLFQILHSDNNSINTNINTNNNNNNNNNDNDNEQTTVNTVLMIEPPSLQAAHNRP
jgi:hypothetical protein